MSDERITDPDQIPDDTEGGLIVLKKLRETLEEQLNIDTVLEPNNAISRRSVRITPTGTRLSRLPANPQGSFTPYELILNLQIAVRLSGGNAGDFLTSQIVQTGTAFNCVLDDDLLIVKDVDQELSLLRNDTAGGFIRNRIVGDAELTGARRISFGIENNAGSDTQADRLHVWTETWAAQLVMTLHRDFHNPPLQTVTYTDERTQEELVVNGIHKDS